MTKMKVDRESDQYLVAHELSKFTSSTATNVVVGKVREVVGDSIAGCMSTGTATDLVIDEMHHHTHFVVSSRKQNITSSAATVVSSNMPVPITDHKTTKMNMNTSSDSSSYALLHIPGEFPGNSPVTGNSPRLSGNAFPKAFP